MCPPTVSICARRGHCIAHLHMNANACRQCVPTLFNWGPRGGLFLRIVMSARSGKLNYGKCHSAKTGSTRRLRLEHPRGMVRLSPQKEHTDDSCSTVKEHEWPLRLNGVAKGGSFIYPCHNLSINTQEVFNEACDKHVHFKSKRIRGHRPEWVDNNFLALCRSREFVF